MFSRKPRGQAVVSICIYVRSILICWLGIPEYHCCKCPQTILHLLNKGCCRRFRQNTMFSMSFQISQLDYKYNTFKAFAVCTEATSLMFPVHAGLATAAGIAQCPLPSHSMCGNSFHAGVQALLLVSALSSVELLPEIPSPGLDLEVQTEKQLNYLNISFSYYLNISQLSQLLVSFVQELPVNSKSKNGLFFKFFYLNFP